MKLSRLFKRFLIVYFCMISYPITAKTPTSLSYSRDGEKIALVQIKKNKEYLLKLFNVKTGKKIKSFPVKKGTYPLIRFHSKSLSIYTMRLFESEYKGVRNEICRYNLKGKIRACFSENIPKLFEYHAAQNQILTTSLYYNATSEHSGGFVLKGKDLSVIEKINADTFRKATALAFHPSKKLIAAATIHDLGVYHQGTQKEVKRFSIHATTGAYDEIYNLSWSMDGSHIAAGYSNGSVGIWSWEKGIKIKTLTSGYTGYVVPIYSKDGQKLVVGDQISGSIKVYRTPDYPLHSSYPVNCGMAGVHPAANFGPEKSPQRFAISPDSLKTAITCMNRYKEIPLQLMDENTPPSITITMPENLIINPKTTLALRASAADAEDGNLSQAIQWTSSMEKELGSGRALDVSLSHGGKHIVTAMAVDSKGLTGSEQMIVRVNRSPEISEFMWEKYGLGRIMFFVTVTDKDENLTIRVVEFGDGERIENWPVKERPVHRYAKNGTYWVTLSGKDALGMSVKKTRKITVTDAN